MQWRFKQLLQLYTQQVVSTDYNQLIFAGGNTEAVRVVGMLPRFICRLNDWGEGAEVSFDYLEPVLMIVLVRKRIFYDRTLDPSNRAHSPFVRYDFDKLKIGLSGRRPETGEWHAG
jgi:hypothetical protein